MRTKYCLIILLLSVGAGLLAQENNKESWRDSGYKARLDGNLEKSITDYLQVLIIDSSDYDAKLALARLYYNIEDYKKSIHFYALIYKNDHEDVEALNGFGRCYLRLGKLSKASYYFEQAINYYPGDINMYFDLALAYSWNGNLDKAIETYNNIMKIDDSYSEAWAGIGKMLYWKQKPKSAIPYYKKALELDPDNEGILKEFNNILNEVKFQFTASLKPVEEKEESYQIDAIIQQYSLSKRLGNHFNVSANFLLDHSNRVFTNNIGDTNRWYDNTWLKINWINANHNFNAYAGYSNSDNQFSSYGFSWKWKFKIKQFLFENIITAGYNYFYYWNRIGGTSVSNQLSIKFKKFGVKGGYLYGVVNKAEIMDYYRGQYEAAENPHISYNFSLSYKLLSKPSITLSLNHSFMDFKYKSPLYYTPYGRKLTGAAITTYYPLKRFYIYGEFSYNLGTEYYYDEGQSSKFKKTMMDVDNWSLAAELGYNLKAVSFSLGGYKFYNPYYQSISGYLTIKLHL